MKKLKEFVKKEIVFSIALVLTVISMCFVPPDAGYVKYIDFKVLALLFCLMAVVEGFKSVGLFEAISYQVLSRTRNLRTIGILLTMVCFFAAMLVTNDVALITFVPLTFILLGDNDDENDVIFVIVMETIAANLGSMVTPIGNPQNLYLYSFYGMEIGEFLCTVLPYGIISMVLIVLVMCIRLKKSEIDIEIGRAQLKNKGKMAVYVVLFGLCLAVVLNKLAYPVCFGIIFVTMLVLDWKILKKVDYILLLTFVWFFIFVGNVGSVESIRNLISSLIEGRVLLVGAGLSQVISNVPAAVMLAGFTNDAKELILGVDLGGLGTLVASLASLISYKFYAQKYPKNIGKYIGTFTTYNIGFLMVLLGVAHILLYVV